MSKVFKSEHYFAKIFKRAVFATVVKSFQIKQVCKTDKIISNQEETNAL